MFPGQGDQFGSQHGADGGSFFGGSAGGPPPADAMFESFLGDELDALEGADVPRERESEVLAAGLHFFENMKAMR